jgi:2-dehydropantoate 2-reductase
MKIAIVGCGALGSYYGAQLCRAGQEVHFLLRTDFDIVRRQGVEVRSAAGDFHVHPRCARVPAEIGPCDLILIGLKTTANAQLARLLPPLVGPQTALLTLQNGLGNEAQLAALFGAQNILGGLCFVCLNRREPGIIQHVAHGKIVLGEFAGQPQPRTHALAARFRDAGVPCEVTDDLARTHWEKLVWNIPFNGLGVAGAAGYTAVRTGNVSASDLPGSCLTTDRLLADPAWEQLVRELMAEVIHTARALGLAIPDTVADEQIDRTRTMGAYRASTLIDFAHRQPIELESLFLEPLRQAQATGVSTPRLAALCQVLTVLNPK